MVEELVAYQTKSPAPLVYEMMAQAAGMMPTSMGKAVAALSDIVVINVHLVTMTMAARAGRQMLVSR